ncbi:capsid assembly scaffolding protein Gp46 family protein [Secundilactobacillus kimchicus]|uniref:capsid assembly scaffolding protein Gp46 family protein n=1 Tax=Secundilactobacillus kimchicus TaxID=528209 RepID=UPI0024A8649D|nr:DUF4355 domain-containing protein [Secundilactobacillus kimchicus]
MTTVDKKFNALRRFDGDNGGGAGGNGDGDEKKYTQVDLNRVVASSVKEALAKADAKHQTDIKKLQDDFDKQKDDLINQGKKLAGETAQQEAERKFNAQQESLQRQIDDFNKEKAKTQAQMALNSTRDLLKAKGLPEDMAEYLSDVDPEVLKNNVEKFEKTFNGRLEQAVDDKLKGTHNPGAGGQGGSGEKPTVKTKEEFEKMTLGDRMQFAADFPETYREFKNK